MKKFEAVVYSCSLVVFSGISFNFGMLLMTLMNNNLFSQYYLFTFIMSFILSFIILPTVILKLTLKKSIQEITMNLFNFKRLIILLLFIWIFSFYFVGIEATVEYLIVSIGEEFLFRHLILLILMSTFKKNTSVIIGSLIFALLLHLNGNIFINLFTKFPISLFLYHLATKYKLQDAIAFHWVYNVLIFKFS